MTSFFQKAANHLLGKFAKSDLIRDELTHAAFERIKTLNPFATAEKEDEAKEQGKAEPKSPDSIAEQEKVKTNIETPKQEKTVDLRK